MPELIQRVPRGLLELLSISGGLANKALLDEVRGVVDQLQFYGLQQQKTVGAVNAALTEGTALDITNVTAGCQFAILFSASFGVIKTATMTALRSTLSLSRCGSTGAVIASSEGGPFGATETGTVQLPWVAPYPTLLVPPWTVRGRMDILGTDANASTFLGIEIGVLT